MLIYPRDLLNGLKTGLSQKAFVMMPFAKEFDKTYVSILDACKELGIKCFRADSLFDQKPILTNVVESIGTSQILIADLTSKNPNVFYEVGIAHANRRLESTILISQTLDDVPFDLRHLPILLYSQDEELKFRLALQQRLEVSLAVTNGLNTIRHLMHGAEFNNLQIASFIDYFSSKSAGDIQKISEVLDDRCNNIDQLEEVYWSTIRLIDEAPETEKRQLQYIAISLLSSDFALREKRKFIEEQLQPVLTDRYKASTIVHPPVIAQLCFLAINNGFLKQESISWLLGYLKNEKMGQIDILRSQIESWLVDDRDNDVEVALISNLNSNLPHMREAAADILGMRRNLTSYNRIADALEIETDPYAARSMITALSRGNASEFCDGIEDWILKNSNLWNDGPKSPTLPSTARKALERLGYNASRLQQYDVSITNIVS